MAEHAVLIEQEPLVVHTRPAFDLNEEAFFQFCQINRELQIERNSEGDLLIVPPDSGSIGLGTIKLLCAVNRWAEWEGTGEVLGTTGFNLPNGATLARCGLGPQGTAGCPHRGSMA